MLTGIFIRDPYVFETSKFAYPKGGKIFIAVGATHGIMEKAK